MKMPSIVFDGWLVVAPLWLLLLLLLFVTQIGGTKNKILGPLPWAVVIKFFGRTHPHRWRCILFFFWPRCFLFFLVWGSGQREKRAAQVTGQTDLGEISIIFPAATRCYSSTAAVVVTESSIDEVITLASIALTVWCPSKLTLVTSYSQLNWIVLSN